MSEGFVHPVAVRYLEVDGQGVVFNMWYFAYFDDALTGFFAHHGVAYADLMAQGYDVQLVHAEVDWRGGVGWQDDLGIAVRLVRRGTTSFTLAYRALRGGEPVCDAEIVYVCVANRRHRQAPSPRPAPARARQVSRLNLPEVSGVRGGRSDWSSITTGGVAWTCGWAPST